MDKATVSGAVDTGSIPVRDARNLADHLTLAGHQAGGVFQLRNQNLTGGCMTINDSLIQAESRQQNQLQDLKTDLYNRLLLIGNCRVENPLALAPMAGTSDVTFRRICRRFGAGLVVTELVSARGISHDPQLRRQFRYLEIAADEQPVAIQLFGSEPDDFVAAIEIILAHPQLSQVRLFDINAGCPVKKVADHGAGSALMLQPERLAAIMSKSVRAAAAAGVAVTAKIRTGWDADNLNAVEIARLLEDCGAAAVTVHGRTRRQMYSGKADWQTIAQVKAAVKIPVYGNGDVIKPGDARRMLNETGVDGVMIGRAAAGNPWLFQEMAAELSGLPVPPRPEIEARVPIILEHLDGLILRHGEDVAVREMRKHLIQYFKGTPCGAALKNQAMQARTRNEICQVLADWYSQHIKY